MNVIATGLAGLTPKIAASRAANHILVHADSTGWSACETTNDGSPVRSDELLLARGELRVWVLFHAAGAIRTAALRRHRDDEKGGWTETTESWLRNRDARKLPTVLDWMD